MRHPNLKQRLDECQREKVKDHFGVNDVTDDDEKCKFYTDLTWMQLMCMWNFLGSCKNKLIYWNQPLKNGDTSPSKWQGGNYPQWMSCFLLWSDCVLGYSMQACPTGQECQL